MHVFFSINILRLQMFRVRARQFFQCFPNDKLHLSAFTANYKPLVGGQ